MILLPNIVEEGKKICNPNLGGWGVVLPPIGFLFITQKPGKSCNLGILQHSVTYF